LRLLLLQELLQWLLLLSLWLLLLLLLQKLPLWLLPP
jgi:hypothetical protein